MASSEQNIRQFVAEDKGIDARTINAVRVLKRSIDARQRTIFINLTVRVYINELPQDDEYVSTEYGDVSSKPTVIVVGEALADCLPRFDSLSSDCALSCWSVARMCATVR